MKFTKLHGCGNDYVYVNLFEETIENPAELSIEISDRHFGIGSDGLITIGPSEVADFRMRIYNADGSEAEMCGNAIRCVAKYVYDHKLTDKIEISIETGAGIKYLTLYVIGTITFEEMFHQLETAIHQFAKRQMTWFRGMERRGIKIHWIDASLPMEKKVEEIIQLTIHNSL